MRMSSYPIFNAEEVQREPDGYEIYTCPKSMNPAIECHDVAAYMMMSQPIIITIDGRMINGLYLIEAVKKRKKDAPLIEQCDEMLSYTILTERL